MLRNCILLFFFSLTLTGCFPTQSTSVLTTVTYDEKSNKTTYIIVPYGNVDIPGKWTKDNYIQISRQQYFINSDSTTLAIAKNPKQKYPFYSDTKTDFELVKDFYKWDADYWVGQGLKESNLKENKEKNYVVWKVFGNKIENIFLYGLKNGLIINYMISTDSWNEIKIIDFLEQLYNEN